MERLKTLLSLSIQDHCLVIVTQYDLCTTLSLAALIAVIYVLIALQCY